MKLIETIHLIFSEVCSSCGQTPVSPLTRETILLRSGLDSLGFAILVARLEEALGYDPFLIMENPVYPQTFGDFVDIYEKFQPAK